MSTWDYRIIRRVVGDEEQFDIRDVYYDDSGRIEGWALEPSGPGGTTLDELHEDLLLMAAAGDQPVLEYADLPGSATQKENRIRDPLVQDLPDVRRRRYPS